MSEVSDDHIKKLSEAIVENDEIINDVNILIKEIKSIKEVTDEIYEKYKKECTDLTEDLDEMIDVINGCKQEDDPAFKSFDSKKKTARSNGEKSKKQLTDALLKLEKTLAKNKETQEKKKKGILKNAPKNDEEVKGKKSKNAKKTDVDAGSTKSESVIEDVSDVEEADNDNGDISKKNDKDKGKNNKEKDKEDKGKGKNDKDENNKDNKNSKSNKKDKDKIGSVELQDEHGKKSKKDKDNMTKDVKFKDGDKMNDRQPESSLNIDKDEDNESDEVDNHRDGTSKIQSNPKGKSLLPTITNEDKEKTKNDTKKDKDNKFNRNKDVSIEDVENDKNKKKGDKIFEDSRNIDSEDEVINKDKKKIKNKKADDTESIGDKHESSTVEDIKKKDKKSDKSKKTDDMENADRKKDKVQDDKKKDKKNTKGSKTDDSESIDGKSDDKKKDKKETKDSKMDDSVSIDGESDKKKKDKKKTKGSKTDDSESIDGKSDDKKKDKKETKDSKMDDSVSIDGESDKKKKDKKKTKGSKTDDSESIDGESDKKKKDKKKDKVLKSSDSVGDVNKTDGTKIKSSLFKSKKSAKKSDIKDSDNDKDIETTSVTTQESIKSESDYYEDFVSDEEDNKESVIKKKEAKSESKAPKSAKPTSSLKRQQIVDSDEENSHLNKSEELNASSTFENIGGFYVVIKPFTAESEDDLSGYFGEKLTIIDINDDGYWLAKNEEGQEGFVPIANLKPVKETNEDSVEQPAEETIKAKDAKTESEVNTDKESAHPKRGNQLWDEIRETMKEKGLTDVLKAFGSLPTGFRFSTLAAWSSKKQVECSMKAHLCPKLSDSDLSFKDLQHDTVENKIRPRPVRIQRTVQIMKSFQMTATNEKFVVKSRHIRLCLFNGERAISNIQTMRATVTDKDTKTWNFNSKITDSTNSMDFNEIFLRINHTSTELSLLIEFCMLGFKSKNLPPTPASGTEVENTQKKNGSVKITEDFNDNELVEFSVGWTTVPLYESNGQLITSKNGDYELFGGTPYEEGLEVDPNTGRSATVNKSKSTQPQVSVRISMPSKENKDLMETLPDTIVGSTLHLTNLSYYRRILSEELMDRRQNLTSAEPIYSPFLVSFMEIADDTDLLDVMRTVWIEKMKTVKNLDKKDYVKMNKIFQETYMESIYPLSKVMSLQKSNLARQDVDQMRAAKIKQFVQHAKSDKLSVLLSGDYAYAPLSFEEFSYKVVSKYSRTVKI